MLLHTPGEVVRIIDAPIGGCVLFRFFDNTSLGFIVETDNAKFLLDPEAVTQSGDAYPAVYPMHGIGEETCMHLPSARLRPDLRLECVGRGYAASGGVSKALYIEQKTFVVQAVLGQQRVAKFDLGTGRFWPGGLSSSHFTTQWGVEVPNADGRHEELVRFKV